MAAGIRIPYSELFYVPLCTVCAMCNFGRFNILYFFVNNIFLLKYYTQTVFSVKEYITISALLLGYQT
jgi:hypothetical protein